MRQALYTEYLDAFLERHESSQEWANVVAKFNKFPTFDLIPDNTIDFYQLFLEKYRYREIGSEDEEMFYFYLNNTLNEVSIKYIPKIRTYLTNFIDLMNRKLTLTQDGDSQNLLYPINNQNGKLATGVQFKGTKEQALLIFKTQPEILNQVMDMRDLYLDCLQEFETCFMGVM